MKKKVIVAISIVLAILLLCPIPMRLKDGGTVKYQAVLYSISDVHRLAATENDVSFETGVIIKILGFEVFNNVATATEKLPSNEVDKDIGQAESPSFHAKVLEVHDNYLLVEPLADSKESKSSDKIEIPLKEKESWPVPAVDDFVKIVYDGYIMETYPAQLGTVYRVEILTIKPTIQSGGTSAHEEFDITVSYANWGERSEIYTKALNTDKMAIGSIEHLPIYKFNTLAELEQFKNDVKDVLSIDAGYDEIPSFNEATAKYDENFFTENSLLLVYVEANSGSYRYDVDSIYHAEDNFTIHIKQTNNPEEHTTDMAGWFITIAVPDSMVADCTVFDADMQW